MAPFHVGLRATNHLFCYARGISFLLMITFVNPLSFHYQGFEYDDARIEGDATLAHSEIQLTSATKYQSNAYSVGRVTSFNLQSDENVSNQIPPMAASPVPNPNPSPIATANISPKQEANKGLLKGIEIEAQKIRQCGFGGVYRGYLKDLNSNVAIKRISRESKQGIKEYANEIKIISQLRHRNLVQLIVLYLHEEWEQCVLHRDIKSSNAMLDSSFNAKLGDFGLAGLVDHDKGPQTTVLAGTMGYIAPEYCTTGKARKESDIIQFWGCFVGVSQWKKTN
ncbi:L-type lectin-domain containing receptor kinase IX.1 [Glycine soja]|nr:L-type lectin-domain containing receptor kinase IX.1 [Glycine soja]